MTTTNDTLIVISGKRKKSDSQISIRLSSLRKIICKVTIGLLFTLPFARCSKSNDFSTSYHPFTSSAAKQRYLNFYDKEARLWPVPAETLSVSGTYGKTFIRISGPVDAPPIVLIPGGAGKFTHLGSDDW